MMMRGAKKTYLGLDVEYAPSAFPLNLTNGVEAGPVQVARELGMLDERPVGNELFEPAAGYKKILLAVRLARSRRSSSVWRWVRSPAKGQASPNSFATYGTR